MGERPTATRQFNVLYTGPTGAGVATSLGFVAHARGIVPDPHPRLGFELVTRGGERLAVHADVRTPEVGADVFAALARAAAPDATRRMRQWLEPRLAAHVAFLRQIDGVVFVLDSALERMASNQERLDAFVSELARVSRTPETIPMVFQCNKRDTHDALPFETMVRLYRWPRCRHVPTMASKGERVADALRDLVGMMVDVPDVGPVRASA